MELKDLSGVEKQAYIHLQRDGAMTKKELQDRMGLKPSTMGRILETLIKAGLIEETIDQSVNSLGRKPFQYDIAHLHARCMGNTRDIRHHSKNRRLRRAKQHRYRH